MPWSPLNTQQSSVSTVRGAFWHIGGNHHHNETLVSWSFLPYKSQTHSIAFVHYLQNNNCQHQNVSELSSYKNMKAISLALIILLNTSLQIFLMLSCADSCQDHQTSSDKWIWPYNLWNITFGTEDQRIHGLGIINV